MERYRDKYYVIPVTCREAELDGVPFIEMLKHVDEDLYNRVIERDQLVEAEAAPELIHQFDVETKKMFAERNVPQKLCFVHTFDKIKEWVSHKPLSGDFGYLEVFSMDRTSFDRTLTQDKIYPYSVAKKDFFDVFDYSATENFIQKGLAAKNEEQVRK